VKRRRYGGRHFGVQVGTEPELDVGCCENAVHPNKNEEGQEYDGATRSSRRGALERRTEDRLANRTGNLVGRDTILT
jgi:hypothetical protein